MTKIEPCSTVAISTTHIINDEHEEATTRRTNIVVVSPTNDKKKCDEHQQPQLPTVVKEVEQEQQSSSIVIVNDMDILAGRGGKTNNHKGNRMFRRLVNDNRHAYQNECKKPKQKYYLAVSIVIAMENVGSRFLKQQKLESGDSSGGNEQQWMIVPRREAIAKTCQALREQPCSHQELSSAASPIVRSTGSLSKQAIACAVAASSNRTKVEFKLDLNTRQTTNM